MQPALRKVSRGDPHEASLAIERFLKASRKPVLIEAGEDPILITPETFLVTARSALIVLECWDEKRNLSRRVTGVKLERPGRLELEIERFSGAQKGSPGTLTLADLARATNHHLERKGIRQKYRERFRQSLHRQFPDWRISEISCEQDLHHSFSPIYPRALLRKGTTALAAIGAPEDSPAPEAALSFGLIWLDYLRRREPRLAMEGLVLFVQAGGESTLCHRIRFLNPRAARYMVFVHDGATFEQQINPHDYTNLDTRMDISPLQGTPLQQNNLLQKRSGPRRFAQARFCQPAAEAVLESKVRAQIEQIDATLRSTPVYGQVPQFAGGDRGLMDLLAVDHEGRLAVIELKVGQDIHLPLQALDYWMRVKWYLDRGEFMRRGYFGEISLRPDPPRLLLVAPAMEFHPSNETVLKYFAPEISVQRIGIGIEWRRELKVVFRPPAKEFGPETLGQ